MRPPAQTPNEPLAGAANDFKTRPAIPRIWLVAGGGWGGRAIQVACQLASVRILTDSLGTSGYGVFAVLGSLTGWLALSDLCVAASLQNHISERRASNRQADDIILTAAFLALVMCVFTALILLLLGPWISAFLLGQFDFMTPGERTTAFYAMTFPGIGTALGGILYKVWLANHRGYLASLLPAAGTVLGTAGVWLVARAGPEAILPWSILVFYAPLGVLPVALLIRTIIKAARVSAISLSETGPLLHRGFRFWVFGMLSAGVLQVDYVIMARVLAADEIVTYSIATRLFGLIFFVYTALLTALWPVCSEHIHKGEWDAVFRAVRKYVVIGAVFTIVCGFLVFMTSPLIVSIISPSLDVVLPVSVIAILTVYTVVRVWTDTFGMVLQSMNDLKVFWLVVPFQSAISIGLQVAGAHFFGLPGMIVGLTLCFLLTVAWVLPRRCLRHAHSATPRY